MLNYQTEGEKSYVYFSQKINMSDKLFSATVREAFHNIIKVIGKNYSHSSRLELIYEDICLMHIKESEKRMLYWDEKIKNVPEKYSYWKYTNYYKCNMNPTDKYQSILSSGSFHNGFMAMHFNSEDNYVLTSRANKDFSVIDNKYKIYRNDENAFYGIYQYVVTGPGIILYLDKQKNKLFYTDVRSGRSITHDYTCKLTTGLAN